MTIEGLRETYARAHARAYDRAYDGSCDGDDAGHDAGLAAVFARARVAALEDERALLLRLLVDL